MAEWVNIEFDPDGAGTGPGGGTVTESGSGGECCCGSGSGTETTVNCIFCPPFAPADYRIRVTRIHDTSDPAGCLLDFDTSANPDFVFDARYLHFGTAVCGDSIVTAPLFCWTLPIPDPNGYQLTNVCGTLRIVMSFIVNCGCGIPHNPKVYDLWMKFQAQAFVYDPFACPTCTGVVGRINVEPSIACSGDCAFEDLLGSYSVNVTDATFGTQYTIDFVVEPA